VDVLGAIGQGRTYDDLLPESLAVDLGGVSVQVLGLAAVIRTKEEAGRDKDRAVLDILRRTLRGSSPR
jgi:predicted nucleotidyltransferase